MSVTDVVWRCRPTACADPVLGKRPTLPGWQHKTEASPQRWRMWPGANTGALTAYTPRSTSTSPTPRRPTLAEQVAKELFGDRGRC